ncbi:hypothetical protein MPSEU_000646500 [Mayamaea pseudoterrestris]|nr:hypothetical protein MPSEU_000646500 [Mayamaea pseudoterrestris]
MNSTIKPDQLSYTEMVLDIAGSIVSREEKAQLRQQYGYCMTCQDTPVLLVDFQRARLNPLWSSKKPRSADGECLNGKCLRCNPHIIPTASCAPFRSGPIPSASQQSITSCDSAGSFGLPMESFHSSSSHRPSLLSGPSSSRRSGGNGGSNSNGSFTVNELTEPPRRIRSTDHMPLSARDSRPMPPRRTVSFDRTPQAGTVPLRSGSRRQPVASLNSVTEMVAGDAVSSSSTTTAGRQPSIIASTSEHGRSTPRRLTPARTYTIGGGRMTEIASISPPASSELHRTMSNDLVPVAPGESSRSFGSLSGAGSTCCEEEEKVAETLDEEWSSSSMKSPEPMVEEEQIVYDLRSLIDGMKGEDVAFLAEILLGSMEANEQHQGVQAYCLEAMADIFQDAVTESTALVSKIVSVMKAFAASLTIQRNGCKVLSALAGNANNCVVLIRAKACETIADALSRNIGDAALVEVAIGGLRKLSTSWEARVKLLNQHISDRVAEAMQCHANVADIQRDGCALLSNVAVDGEKRRVCVVSLDILEATVASIKSHSQEATVVQSACFALKNFTYDATNLRSLTKVHGVFEVLHAAACQELDDCEDCFVVLERIQLARAEDESLEEQALEAMLKLTDVAEIVGAMRKMEWSAKVIAQGFELLTPLAAQANHKEDLEKKEIHAQLFGFIEQYITDIQVQQEAQTLMSGLSDVSSGSEGVADVPCSEPLASKIMS